MKLFKLQPLLLAIISLQILSANIFYKTKYFTLTGTVSDENHKPIPMVTVKSLTSLTYTDENGHFSISDVELNEELVFNSTNYKIMVVKIQSKDEMTVILKRKNDDEIFTEVEQVPVFPGGINGLTNFLQKNLKYPKKARRKLIQGKVFATFVVTSSGDIDDVKIIKGIGGDCDEETVRVIKLMPKWVPGTQDGKKVSVKYTLPINFNLGR